MLTLEENELLTRVGRRTPGGELLRRYWHVVAAASEITDEKPKKRVRVLGEDLVLYRGPSGKYGLVAEHCAHRGASLYYGFVEEDGIQLRLSRLEVRRLRQLSGTAFRKPRGWVQR
jgi:5,5'-dehydrodivanillate O-demethylase oxygenase subunit